jgi:hypothetical protein
LRNQRAIPIPVRHVNAEPLAVYGLGFEQGGDIELRPRFVRPVKRGLSGQKVKAAAARRTADGIGTRIIVDGSRPVIA